MADGIYLDNDVVLKACAYGVGPELIRLTTIDETLPAILAIARHTIASRVKRSRDVFGLPSVRSQIDVVLDQVRQLEPTGEEVELAADLEASATRANLSFDTGESQLMAMLLTRRGRMLASGDKRAAKAISVVLPCLACRLVCLEQILAMMVERVDPVGLRLAICRSTAVDRAISICFQCSRTELDAAEVRQALASYIGALRLETGRLLVEDGDPFRAEVAEEDCIRGS